MPELQPQPISSFREITNKNGFNSGSVVPILDANTNNPAEKNAVVSVATLSDIIETQIFPIEDSQINTGITPSNITQTPLTNITGIQVNQYGRVVSLQGNNSTQSGSSVSVTAATFTGVSDRWTAPTSTTFDFTASATGTILLNCYITYNMTPYNSGSFNAGVPANITHVISSSLKTNLAVPSINLINTTTQGGATNVPKQVYGTSVYVIQVTLPCTVGETNWVISPTPGTASSGFPLFASDYSYNGTVAITLTT